MQKRLFPECDVFQEKRPTTITKEQEEKYYNDLANEIIDNNWSTDHPDDIIEDLKGLSPSDNGYEMAKDLDDHAKNASFQIDSNFVEFLDGIEWGKQDIINDNVKLWIDAHKPQPSFKEGQKLRIDKHLRSQYKTGAVIYVIGIEPRYANYIINKDSNGKGGTPIPYEILELNTSIELPIQ